MFETICVVMTWLGIIVLWQTIESDGINRG